MRRRSSYCADLADCSKACQRKAYNGHKDICKRYINEMSQKFNQGRDFGENDVIAVRDAAAGFIARMHESFRALAPAIFRGRDLASGDYLHIDATLFERPGVARGPDMLDGVINGAEVRSRSSWKLPVIRPWCVADLVALLTPAQGGARLCPPGARADRGARGQAHARRALQRQDHQRCHCPHRDADPAGHRVRAGQRPMAPGSEAAAIRVMH